MSETDRHAEEEARFEFPLPEGARLVVGVRTDGLRTLTLSRPGNSATTLDLDATSSRRLATVLGGGPLPLPALEKLEEALKDVRVEWFAVAPASRLSGWTIGDLAIRKTTGVSVVALIRRTESFLNPGPEHQVQAGDTVVVLGRNSQVEAFRERYRPGG